MDPETEQKQKKLAAAARETGMADSGPSENAVKVLERSYLAKDKNGQGDGNPRGDVPAGSPKPVIRRTGVRSER